MRNDLADGQMLQAEGPEQPFPCATSICQELVEHTHNGQTRVGDTSPIYDFPVPTNSLYYGDNLEVLRQHISDESVDLIYLDPPFNSNATYNVLFKTHDGDESRAQIEAFDDTWRWGPQAEEEYAQLTGGGCTSPDSTVS